ncbi:histone lysine demethylase jmjd4 [Cystoisospora suis]|uniref:Histone lysine demethylase jmjd4 n=1 Tax=Cystoisospora suis TaxID=483139 RepID=A0A2C6LGH7_9APIC|nr:histone lysine demethylase jmjd4 [Cystoisospora suis]
MSREERMVDVRRSEGEGRNYTMFPGDRGEDEEEEREEEHKQEKEEEKEKREETCNEEMKEKEEDGKKESVERERLQSSYADVWNAKDLSYSVFLKKYLSTRTPVVIRGVCTPWTSYTHWVERPTLEKRSQVNFLRQEKQVSSSSLFSSHLSSLPSSSRGTSDSIDLQVSLLRSALTEACHLKQEEEDHDHDEEEEELRKREREDEYPLSVVTSGDEKDKATGRREEEEQKKEDDRNAKLRHSGTDTFQSEESQEGEDEHLFLSSSSFFPCACCECLRSLHFSSDSSTRKGVFGSPSYSRLYKSFSLPSRKKEKNMKKKKKRRENEKNRHSLKKDTFLSISSPVDTPHTIEEQDNRERKASQEKEEEDQVGKEEEEEREEEPKDEDRYKVRASVMLCSDRKGFPTCRGCVCRKKEKRRRRRGEKEEERNGVGDSDERAKEETEAEDRDVATAERERCCQQIGACSEVTLKQFLYYWRKKSKEKKKEESKIRRDENKRPKDEEGKKKKESLTLSSHRKLDISQEEENEAPLHSLLNSSLSFTPNTQAHLSSSSSFSSSSLCETLSDDSFTRETRKKDASDDEEEKGEEDVLVCPGSCWYLKDWHFVKDEMILLEEEKKRKKQREKKKKKKDGTVHHDVKETKEKKKDGEKESEREGTQDGYETAYREKEKKKDDNEEDQYKKEDEEKRKHGEDQGMKMDIENEVKDEERFYHQSIHYNVPNYFEDDWILKCPFRPHEDFRFCYLGPECTYTPWHSDVLGTSSWSANLCGVKRWTFEETPLSWRGRRTRSLLSHRENSPEAVSAPESSISEKIACSERSARSEEKRMRKREMIQIEEERMRKGDKNGEMNMMAFKGKEDYCKECKRRHSPRHASDLPFPSSSSSSSSLLYCPRPLRCLLQFPGECVYVPSNVHHSVCNLTDCISINHNWCNAANILHVANALKEDYLSVQDFLLDDFPGAQGILQSLKLHERERKNDNEENQDTFSQVPYEHSTYSHMSSSSSSSSPFTTSSDHRTNERLKVEEDDDDSRRRRDTKETRKDKEEREIEEKIEEMKAIATAEELNEYVEFILSQESILTANCGCNFFLLFFFLLHVARKLLLPRLKKHIRHLQSFSEETAMMVDVHSKDPAVIPSENERFSQRKERMMAPREKEKKKEMGCLYEDKKDFQEKTTSSPILMAFTIVGSLRVCSLLKALSRAEEKSCPSLPSSSHSTDMQADGKSTHAGKTSLFSSGSSSASPLMAPASVNHVYHSSLQFLPSTADTVRHRLEFLVPLSFLFPKKEKQNEARGNETPSTRESERSDPEKLRTQGDRLASEDLQWCVRDLLEGVDLVWQELSKQERLRDMTLHNIVSFTADGGGEYRSETERQLNQDDSFSKNEKRLDETYSEERRHREPGELPGLAGKEINGERQAEESCPRITVRQSTVERFLGFPFQDFDLTNEWLWKKVTFQCSFREHWDLHTPVVSYKDKNS